MADTIDALDTPVTGLAVLVSRPERVFPTLTPEQLASGDVRGGNVKRVASAVGEGSIAVAFVHQVLRQTGAVA